MREKKLSVVICSVLNLSLEAVSKNMAKFSASPTKRGYLAIIGTEDFRLKESNDRIEPIQRVFEMNSVFNDLLCALSHSQRHYSMLGRSLTILIVFRLTVTIFPTSRTMYSGSSCRFGSLRMALRLSVLI